MRLFSGQLRAESGDIFDCNDLEEGVQHAPLSSCKGWCKADYGTELLQQHGLIWPSPQFPAHAINAKCQIFAYALAFPIALSAPRWGFLLIPCVKIQHTVDIHTSESTNGLHLLCLLSQVCSSEANSKLIENNVQQKTGLKE